MFWPCHLYGFIHHLMYNWALHRLVYSKVYVDMENLFLFWFCPCDLFVKKKTRHVTRNWFTGLGPGVGQDEWLIHPESANQRGSEWICMDWVGSGMVWHGSGWIHHLGCQTMPDPWWFRWVISLLIGRTDNHHTKDAGMPQTFFFSEKSRTWK